MTSDMELADPAALAAVELRRRLRALASGQTEAFDLLYYQFGAGSAIGGRNSSSAHRRIAVSSMKTRDWLEPAPKTSRILSAAEVFTPLVMRGG